MKVIVKLSNDDQKEQNADYQWVELLCSDYHLDSCIKIVIDFFFLGGGGVVTSDKSKCMSLST